MLYARLGWELVFITDPSSFIYAVLVAGCVLTAIFRRKIVTFSVNTFPYHLFISHTLCSYTRLVFVDRSRAQFYRY